MPDAGVVDNDATCEGDAPGDDVVRPPDVDGADVEGAVVVGGIAAAFDRESVEAEWLDGDDGPDGAAERVDGALMLSGAADDSPPTDVDDDGDAGVIVFVGDEGGSDGRADGAPLFEVGVLVGDVPETGGVDAYGAVAGVFDALVATFVEAAPVVSGSGGAAGVRTASARSAGVVYAGSEAPAAGSATSRAARGVESLRVTGSVGEALARDDSPRVESSRAVASSRFGERSLRVVSAERDGARGA